MYGQNLKDNVMHAACANMTNCHARWSPHSYIKMTGQSGRSAGERSLSEIIDYFKSCFTDYFGILQVQPENTTSCLSGKQAIEYDPNDILSITSLMVVHRAESATCIDCFSLLSHSAKQRYAFFRIFPHIRYLIRHSGLPVFHQVADMVTSRAALKQVNDLYTTLGDVHGILRGSGLELHEVDLRSYQWHRRNSLNFLAWLPQLWLWMYAQKGISNRLRDTYYREAISASVFESLCMRTILLLDKLEIAMERFHLAEPFQDVLDEDASWLELWIVFKKKVLLN